MKALIGLVCLIGGLGCFGCEKHSSESDEVPAGHVRVDLHEVIDESLYNTASCEGVNCNCGAKCEVDEQPLANCLDNMCICLCLGNIPKWSESGEGLETEKEIWEILQPPETPEAEAERLIGAEDGE